jgi:hypothetical protein
MDALAKPSPPTLSAPPPPPLTPPPHSHSSPIAGASLAGARVLADTSYAPTPAASTLVAPVAEAAATPTTPPPRPSACGGAALSLTTDLDARGVGGSCGGAMSSAGAGDPLPLVAGDVPALDRARREGSPPPCSRGEPCSRGLLDRPVPWRGERRPAWAAAC